MLLVSQATTAARRSVLLLKAMPWAQHAMAARNATKRSMEGMAVRRSMDFDEFCFTFCHCKLFSANLKPKGFITAVLVEVMR